MKRAKPSKIHFGGRGWYLLLAVCLIAAGVIGYFTILRPAEPAAPAASSEPPAAQEPASEVIVQTPTPVEPEPAPEPEPTAPARPRIMNPLDGETLAAFSMDELIYDSTMADWRTHNGVDIAAAEGDSVRAAADGTVSAVKNDPLTGVTVVIDHPDSFQTVYANLQENPPASAGQEVVAGDVIGYVGKTAAAESDQESHLHFSVLQNGEIIDPADFLN